MSATMDISAFAKALEDAAASIGDDISMVIGFNTVYAVVQHEDMTFRHESPGQAKYLQTPLRQSGELLNRAIAHHFKGVKSPEQIRPALVKAVRETGLHILGNAQDLAPVGGGEFSPRDPAPGTLKASANWQGPDEGEAGNLGGAAAAMIGPMPAGAQENKRRKK